MIWKLYQLQENFRCASAICQAANRLMRHQPGRPDKQTVSATGQTGEVIVKTDGYQTDDQEAHAVAEDILECIKGHGLPDHQAAVLVRTNFLAEYFRRVLKAHGLPVKEPAKADMPADWARAKAALALLANPDCDRLAYQAILLSAGRQKANEVRARALAEYKTINDTALFLPSDFTASDCGKMLAKMGVSRESLDRIAKAAELLPQDSPVNALGLVIGRQEVQETHGEGVEVLTGHSAKGREFDAVWLPCLEQETLPGCRKGVDVAEERRLLFVMMTRARSRLWLSWARHRAQQWGDPKAMTPSQFLAEAKAHPVREIAAEDGVNKFSLL